MGGGAEIIKEGWGTRKSLCTTAATVDVANSEVVFAFILYRFMIFSTIGKYTRRIYSGAVLCSALAL
jgi:hypothetical protein